MSNIILPYRTNIEKTLSLLKEPHTITELRVLFRPGRGGYGGRVDSGYFDTISLLAEAAIRYEECEDVSGTYITLQPLLPHCLERAKNRMRESVSRNKGEFTTSDNDVLGYKYLFIDVDPVREAKTSSTQTELDAAKAAARRIVYFFRDMGWSFPWVGMSGNGMHLFYDINLPNNKEASGWIKSILTGLAHNFNSPNIKIDTSVGNPSRITKLYPSFTRKGPHSTERPHRRAEFYGRADIYYGIH